MNHDPDIIRDAIDTAEIFARGRNLAWQTECPKCHMPYSLSIRSTNKGKPYMGFCSTAGCIRWHYPEWLTGSVRVQTGFDF